MEMLYILTQLENQQLESIILELEIAVVLLPILLLTKKLELAFLIDSILQHPSFHLVTMFLKFIKIELSK